MCPVSYIRWVNIQQHVEGPPASGCSLSRLLAGVLATKRATLVASTSSLFSAISLTIRRKGWMRRYAPRLCSSTKSFWKRSLHASHGSTYIFFLWHWITLRTVQEKQCKGNCNFYDALSSWIKSIKYCRRNRFSSNVILDCLKIRYFFKL